MTVAELMFLETSALTGENVEEAFVQCARKILNKIESGNSSQSVVPYFQGYSIRNHIVYICSENVLILNVLFHCNKIAPRYHLIVL